MKSDRPPGMGVMPLAQRCRLSELDRRDRSSSQIQTDGFDFDQEFSRASADDEESSSEKDDSPQSKPFDLIPTIPFVSSPVISGAPYEVLAQVFHETVQDFYVSKDDSSKRQVSMTLADDVLPGVTLSVYENEGRIVGDFICVEERSWSRLCQIAERMVSELANQLSRDARIYVRTDDADDVYPFQVNATPEQMASGGAIAEDTQKNSEQGRL